MPHFNSEFTNGKHFQSGKGKDHTQKQVQSQGSGLKVCMQDLLKKATKVTEGDRLPVPPPTTLREHVHALKTQLSLFFSHCFVTPAAALLTAGTVKRCPHLNSKHACPLRGQPRAQEVLCCQDKPHGLSPFSTAKFVDSVPHGWPTLAFAQTWTLKLPILF